MKILGINFGGDKKETFSTPTNTNTKKQSFFHGGLPQRNSYLSQYDIDRFGQNGMVYDGEYNFEPQYRSLLVKNCSLHAAILKFKELLTAGDGYTIETATLKGMELVEAKQFETFFNGEHSITETLPLLAKDYHKDGVIYIEVTWNDDFSKIIARRRLSPERMRVISSKRNGQVDGYLYCYDWLQQGLYGVFKMANFSIANKVDKVQVMRFTTEDDEYYATPTYMSARESLSLEAQIPVFHRSTIENSINPAMAIFFNSVPDSPEEKETILDDIERAFKNPEKAGRYLTFFNENADDKPTIQTIEPSKLDEQYIATSDVAQRNICYAHQVAPIVLGLATPGSLGNSTELPIAFDIFNQSVIEPSQTFIENLVNKLFRLNGLTVNFKINNKELQSLKPKA
jgi:hypothetical protein